MGKKKKTREQKIAATTRHHQHIPIYSLPTIAKPIQTSPHETNHAKSYVAKDLQKTFFISAVLILFEIIMYFLVHQHILKLPYY